MLQGNKVKQQLQGLTRQMDYNIETCHSAKGAIDEEFLSVLQEIQLLEGRISTERSMREGEVSIVGSQMMIQQAVLEELRIGVNVLQQQDNNMVKEATKAFRGISG